MALLPSNIPANNRVPRKYQNVSESSKDPNANAAVDGDKGKFEVETTDSASDSNGGNVGSSESESKKPRLSLVPYGHASDGDNDIEMATWIDCLLISFILFIYFSIPTVLSFFYFGGEMQSVALIVKIPKKLLNLLNVIDTQHSEMLTKSWVW